MEIRVTDPSIASQTLWAASDLSENHPKPSLTNHRQLNRFCRKGSQRKLRQIIADPKVMNPRVVDPSEINGTLGLHHRTLGLTKNKELKAIDPKTQKLEWMGWGLPELIELREKRRAEELKLLQEEWLRMLQ